MPRRMFTPEHAAFLALHDLIAARLGHRTFRVFDHTGEGRYFSFQGAEVEETSGHVVTLALRHYSYWFGPDPVTGAATLTEWEPAEIDPARCTDPEYHAALTSLQRGEQVPPPRSRAARGRRTASATARAATRLTTG